MHNFPQHLIEGYRHFMDGRYARETERYKELARSGQSPTTMVICCCDSRAAPETIFDAGPGELFVLRNVANLVPPFQPDAGQHGTSAAIEFAVNALNIENLYDPKYLDLLHHIYQGLKAHHLYRLDVDYMVKDGEVIIVDDFTGRLMPGRRWSDGLHQAIEAKEKVKVRNENQTLATITFQNYFRMYNKMCGMTGTAETEAVEFKKIYNLDVQVLPPNRGVQREDHEDVVYKTEAAKYRAMAAFETFGKGWLNRLAAVTDQALKDAT